MSHRSTLLFVAGLAAALLVAVGPAAAAVKCTAQQGQLFIDAGRYRDAVREFTCVIDAAPTQVEGYRGRIEAELLLGRFSDAVRDYVRFMALVVPVHPDAEQTITDGYAARLAAAPANVPALTGASFARWWFFDYVSAIHLLNRLVEILPDDVYGNLFRGSSRLLRGVTSNAGAADLEHAIALAPESPDVHYIVADAYTYGEPDPTRALYEGNLALDGRLDTPRVHAILASAYLAFGDLLNAALHIERHLELVTTELVTTAPLAAGESIALDVVPGRTFEIPVTAVAGETLSIATSSEDFGDTILLLVAPDGTPVLGSDDANAYFAAFDWVAEETGTYRVLVTSFEAVSIGEMLVSRN